MEVSKKKKKEKKKKKKREGKEKATGSTRNSRFPNFAQNSRFQIWSPQEPKWEQLGLLSLTEFQGGPIWSNPSVPNQSQNPANRPTHPAKPTALQSQLEIASALVVS